MISHLIELVEKQEDTAPSILINTKVKFIFHKIEEIKVAHYNTREGNDTNSDKECAALDSIKQASTMSISDKEEHFNNLPLTVMVKDPEYEMRPSHFKLSNSKEKLNYFPPNVSSSTSNKTCIISHLQSLTSNKLPLQEI